MKKLLTLLGVLILSFTLISCKNDPEKLKIRYSGSTKQNHYLVSGNNSKDGITNTNVVIPLNIKGTNSKSAIASSGFENARKLDTVKLSSNTIYILDNAFLNSTLNNIEIPSDSKLEIISSNAFKNTNITKIFIPSTVYSIEEGSFDNISDLIIFTKHLEETEVFDLILKKNENITIIYDCDYNDYLNH